MANDIILVTVDCLRYDAPLPKLRNIDWETDTTAIAHSAATAGSFPAILSGKHYPLAYGQDHNKISGVASLPSMLSKNGYETAGFIAGNPFLNRFEGEYDTFWNGGKKGTEMNWDSKIAQLKQAVHFALLRPYVSALNVLNRANNWWESVESPKFMHLHFMETHEPFYPGLRRAFDVGIWKSYKSLFQYSSDRDSLSETQKQQIRSLYNETTDIIDEILYAYLSSVDNSVDIIMTADHGEEFNHGEFRHARLYDEVIKTPLLSTLAVSDESPHRKIPELIANSANINPPKSWQSWKEDEIYALNYSPAKSEIYVAVRTSGNKLIWTLKPDSRDIKRKEWYNISSDPKEMDNLAIKKQPPKHMEENLDEFISDMNGNITSNGTNISESKESHLEALGYY